MARSIEFKSCPARPTKGSPWRSSSAPGASPTMSHSAFWFPTPNTVCVRVLQSVQRVQAATRARSSGQSTPASRAAPASRGVAASRSAVTGWAMASRSGTASAAGVPRTTQPSSPMAARYSRRSALFMRLYRRAIPPAQLAIHPDGRRRQAIDTEQHQQADRQVQKNQNEGDGHQNNIREAHLRPGIDLLEAVERKTADHHRAGGRGNHDRKNKAGKADMGLIAGKPHQGRDNGRRRWAWQALEVVFILGRRSRIEAGEPQRSGGGVEKAHQPT